jgi:hypothetical protein
MRERLMLWGAAAGGAILVFVIAVGLYMAYGWYQQRYGATPERAIERYFSALGDGEYDVMYDMTPDADLMVLGRKLSRREFAARVEDLLGGEELEMEKIDVEPIAQRAEYSYYRVSLHYRLGDTGKVTRILVEVRREGEDWKVTYPFTPSL